MYLLAVLNADATERLAEHGRKVARESGISALQRDIAEQLVDTYSLCRMLDQHALPVPDEVERDIKEYLRQAT